MKKTLRNVFFILSFIFELTLCGSCPELSDTKLKVLYNSLDPTSIAQHLAFYELYPQRSLGQQALRDAWQLLAGTDGYSASLPSESVLLSPSVIHALVTLVNKPLDQELPLLDREAKNTLIHLSSRLHHYSLKGHQIWNEQELLKLPLSEIDLARGLFLSQFGSDRSRIQSYEALIDLMALQILARLPKNASPEEKIVAINAFIFDEMGFRFPPHSLYAKDIDLYTFLPSVLDSRRGVCLGVSILYLCLAQRLALPLEMITPPGHIYVRYCKGDQVINIETTARGIHLDSDEYLSVNTHSLQKRTIREVIGMAHFNQAAVYWQNEEYQKALQAYQKAEPYMQDDPLLKELMGYILILTGYRERGEKLIHEIKDVIPDYAIVKSSMAEDYLEGKVDAKGIGTIFTRVDDDRQSILAKKQALEETLERYPYFRSGILSLAVTWLQLHRAGEALDILKRFESLDKSDPEVHYYLSVLYAQRYDYPHAWHHLQKAEAIAKAQQHDPKILKELRRELLNYCPE
jgi:regulator of sirC expression with transglutaminase-like and TPR domain